MTEDLQPNEQRDRAHASLWWHALDFATDIGGEVARTFPEVVRFTLLICLCVAAPVSFPVIGWCRRRNEQLQIYEWERRREAARPKPPTFPPSA